jgi:hypothetical protein
MAPRQFRGAHIKTAMQQEPATAATINPASTHGTDLRWR